MIEVCSTLTTGATSANQVRKTNAGHDQQQEAERDHEPEQQVDRDQPQHRQAREHLSQRAALVLLALGDHHGGDDAGVEHVAEQRAGPDHERGDDDLDHAARAEPVELGERLLDLVVDRLQQADGDEDHRRGEQQHRPAGTDDRPDLDDYAAERRCAGGLDRLDRPILVRHD